MKNCKMYIKEYAVLALSIQRRQSVSGTPALAMLVALCLCQNIEN